MLALDVAAGASRPMRRRLVRESIPLRHLSLRPPCVGRGERDSNVTAFRRHAGQVVSRSLSTPGSHHHEHVPVLPPSRWGRIVKASSLMIDILGSDSLLQSRPASIIQLMRFYLEKGDLEAARHVIASLQDGKLGRSVLSAGPWRQFFTTLLDGFLHKGDAAHALEVRNRMALAGQPLTKEHFVALVRCCAWAVDGPRADVAAALLQDKEPYATGAPTSDDMQSTWASSPEVCGAVLEVLALADTAQDLVLTDVIPPLHELWSVAVSTGSPSTRLRAAWLCALARKVGTMDAEVEKEVSMAVGGLCEALKQGALVGDDQSAKQESTLIEKAAVAAAHVMIAGGNATGIRTVFVSLPISDAGVLSVIPTNPAHVSPELIQLLLVKASPTATLRVCHAALSSGTTQASADVAVSHLLRLTSEEWLQTNSNDLPELLKLLCSRVGADVVKTVRVAAGHAMPSPPTAPITHALVRCAEVEGRPGRAAALVRKLGKDATQECYTSVLGAAALADVECVSAAERGMLQRPKELVEWVLNRVKGMGGRPGTDLALRALRLYRRSCTLPQVDETHREMCVEEGIALVNRMVADEDLEADDDVFVALIDLAAGGASLRRANELLTQFESVKSSADRLRDAYAPVICATARGGALMAAEQALIRMSTLTYHGPSTTILDAFIDGYTRSGNVPSALTMMQDCFTQYCARPSTVAFTALVEKSLEDGNKYEAQRALVIAEQIWDGEDCRADKERLLTVIDGLIQSKGVA